MVERPDKERFRRTPWEPFTLPEIGLPGPALEPGRQRVPEGEHLLTVEVMFIQEGLFIGLQVNGDPGFLTGKTDIQS